MTDIQKVCEELMATQREDARKLERTREELRVYHQFARQVQSIDMRTEDRPLYFVDLYCWKLKSELAELAAKWEQEDQCKTQ